MLKGVTLSVNDKQNKMKMKKNALEFVDKQTEKKNDPKYKTELCKSFNDTAFCVYGNKCRFAHGRHELFMKPLDYNKYKQKECHSFKELGFCMYGARCNFKHDERKIDDIQRSYYSYMISCLSLHEDDDRICNTDYMRKTSNKSVNSNHSIGYSSLRLKVLQGVVSTKVKQHSSNQGSAVTSGTSSPSNSTYSGGVYPHRQKLVLNQNCFQPLYARLC